MKNKKIILNDLITLLNNNKKWSIWDYSNNINYKNNFSKLSTQQILKRLNNYKDNPKNLQSTWTIFGLILNGKIITDNTILLQKTLNIIKKIPNVINVGFSCLTPNSSTGVHNEIDKGIYRIHLPLIIPKGDCAIQVQNEIKKWYDCKSIMIIDDTKWHNAWNNTKYPRYILIIDVLKKK
jgi:aspartyl/asparaginyl beta-hydroxylase (cupin superfamily)